ncbi:MAG: helix-turn-helix domain-containing protein [Clostridium septicum]|uniref:phBC6A51 family helix-turn-helix protein n=1 Tax=Clostridium septicum TaxID=1504 RepID=UPI0008325C78|nr:helix-turn-helix domain-containing protein [Clostridium septicum]MDU1313922.1 helix-turn-helix domain-containing protein [Clostridium septicum]
MAKEFLKNKQEIVTREQIQMITMLIEGENITDIAKTIGVTRNTIYAWMGKPTVKAELDRRKRGIINQGNAYILKDLTTFISNIKELANDKSDKRVCLAANQYLIDRILGRTSQVIDTGNSGNSENDGQINEVEAVVERIKLKLKGGNNA